MLCNLHTHTNFCDGKSTAEEMVRAAIDKGFTSIGFSGHGYTPFDTSYCMTDTDGYRETICDLKARYGDKIDIYLGVEEDAGAPLSNRSDFEYIIGSYHYVRSGDRYYPLDCCPDGFRRCMELFDKDPIKLADAYYRPFCEYVLARKPDIIGHFDLITKYDECEMSQFLANAAYAELAGRYIKEALKSGCLFEVNTGAIARGYRTTPYPSVDLLHVLKTNGGNLILSSDSHTAESLGVFFDEAKQLLRDIGFQYTYVLKNGEFVKDFL